TPTTVYAGRNGAIAKSTDGGASWKAVSIFNDEARAFVIDYATTSVVYALVHSASGLLKSTDGGDSWTAIGPPDKFLLWLAIDPVTSTTLYGAWVETGTCCSVLKSMDSGVTWVKQSEVLASAFLAIDPVTPTTFYAGSGDGGIFKSVDGGTTWFAAGPNADRFVIDPKTPTTLYAAYTKLECGGIFGPDDCTETGAIYKSINGAATWVQVADIPTYSLAIDPVTPTTLYAGHFGFLKSMDGGATWESPPPPTP